MKTGGSQSYVLEALLDSLKRGLLTKVLAVFTHPLQAPHPAHTVSNNEQKMTIEFKKEKCVRKQDRTLKREKKNQSQQSKRTVGRMFRFQNLKAPS